MPPRQNNGREKICLARGSVKRIRLTGTTVTTKVRVLVRRLKVARSSVYSMCVTNTFNGCVSPIDTKGVNLLPTALIGGIGPIKGTTNRNTGVTLIGRGRVLRVSRLIEGVRFIRLTTSTSFRSRFVSRLKFRANR